MPGAENAPPSPAVPGEVPQRVQIRDARTLDVPEASDVSQEVTVLGIPLATGFFGVSGQECLHREATVRRAAHGLHEAVERRAELDGLLAQSNEAQ